MYFLGGDRIYIKPGHACGTLNEQVEDCLMQLHRINSGKRIFKLNFFVDTASGKDYDGIKTHLKSRVLEEFKGDPILAFIAQPPLTCKIIVEVFYYDPSVWQMRTITSGENAAALFDDGNTQFLVGKVQSNSVKSCQLNSEYAFKELRAVFEKADFTLGHIIRQWNYLENILGYDDKKQRYQEFNNVRSAAYGDSFDENGYPAATGIGMNRGGVIIEFVAVKSEEIISQPVDNPGQVSAHHYSSKVLMGDDCVLKTTPKFERARYLKVNGSKLILISGTASIVGEKTIGTGDPVKQTVVTIDNIRRLYSDEVLQKLPDRKLEPKYGHARIYVKNKRDFAAIKRTFKAHFGNLPVVYLIADICRDDLLVEIEGKVILE